MLFVVGVLFILVIYSRCLVLVVKFKDNVNDPSRSEPLCGHSSCRTGMCALKYHLSGMHASLCRPTVKT